MTLRKKILSGFVCIFLIAMLLGIIGLLSIRKISQLSDEQTALQKTETGIAEVLKAHYAWRQGLTEAILTGEEFTGSLDPSTCALGKWLDSEEAKQMTDEEALSLLAQVKDPHAMMHTSAGDVVALIEAGDLEQAEQLFVTTILPETEATISTLESIEERFAVLADEKGTEIQKLQDSRLIVMLALIAAAIVSCIILTIQLTKSIMKPILAVTEAAKTISTGDLDVDISYPVNDEIGMLFASFQQMVEETRKEIAVLEALAAGDLTMKVSLRGEKDTMGRALQRTIVRLNEMFEDINTASSQVSLGAKQIADGAQSLAQGATEQSATVEQVSSSIAQMSTQIKSSSDMAAHAADLARFIKQSAEAGSAEMLKMTQAVKEIKESSQNISKVMNVIDDIAFQTNILALNAAVEAARAGQHGAGFAVVADEVRNLAAKSAEAAKNTSSLIENSIEKAEYGYRIAEETANSLMKIVSGINESTEIVTNISQSTEEQSAAISEINLAIDQVSQVVQQNSATAEESAASSEEMSGQSEMLHGHISQFKLKSSFRPKR